MAKHKSSSTLNYTPNSPRTELGLYGRPCLFR